MAILYLVLSEHQAHHGYSSDDSWRFSDAGTLEQGFTNLRTGNFNVGRYIQNGMDSYFNTYFCLILVIAILNILVLRGLLLNLVL